MFSPLHDPFPIQKVQGSNTFHIYFRIYQNTVFIQAKQIAKEKYLKEVKKI